MAAVAKSLSIVLGMNVTEADRVSKNFFSALRTSARASADNITGAFGKVLQEFEKGGINARQYGNAIGALQLKFEKLGEEQIKLADAAERYAKYGSLPFTKQKEEIEKARVAAEKLRKEQERLAALAERIRSKSRPGDVLNAGIGDVRNLLGSGAIDRNDAANAIRRLRREYQDATGVTETYNKKVKEGLQLDQDRARRQKEVNEIVRRSRQTVNDQIDRQIELEKETARRGVQQRQAAQADLASQINNRFNPRGQLNRDIRDVQRLVGTGQLSPEVANRELTRLRRNFSETQNGILSFQGAMNSFKASIFGFLGPIAIVYKITEAFGRMLQLTSDLQRNTASIEVFTRSLTQAKSIIAELRELSSTSPVNFEISQKAVRTLLQFGADKNLAVPFVKQLATITGGDTERFDKLALSLAQVQAAGRLMGQELLQMVNAGFNPLQEISLRTGKSMAALKKEMENGEISAMQVAMAFKTATSEGGRFDGLLERLADTTFGQLQKLQSNWDKLLTTVGESSSGPLNDALKSMNRELERANQLVQNLNGFFGGGGSGNGRGIFDLGSTTRVFNPISFGIEFGYSNLFEGPMKARQKILIEREKELEDLVVRRRLQDNSLTQEQIRLADEEIKRKKIIEQLERRVDDKRAQEIAGKIGTQIGVNTNNPNVLNELERQSALREKIGGGFFSREDNELIDSYIQKTKEIQQLNARIDTSFKDLSQGEKDRSLDIAYGKEQAGLLLAVLESSTAEERKKLNILLEQRKTYNEILAVANPAVAARAKEIGSLIAANNFTEARRKLSDRASLIGKDGASLLTAKFAQDGFGAADAAKLGALEQSTILREIQQDFANQELDLIDSKFGRFSRGFRAKGIGDADADALATRKIEIDRRERLKGLDKEIEFAQTRATLGEQWAKAYKLKEEEGISLQEARLEIEKQLHVEFINRTADLTEQIRYERDLLNLGKEKARLSQLGREGFDPFDAKDLLKQETELERLKNRNKLDDKAKDLIKGLNPRSEFIEQMAELNAMLQLGAGGMTQEQYNQAREQLLNAQIQNSPGITAPSAAVQGSQEVAKIIADYESSIANEQIQVQQRIAIASETALEVQQETNRKLDKLIEKQPFVRKGP